MKRTAPVHDGCEAQRQKLLEKREEVLADLGIKFDTLARMGRNSRSCAIRYESIPNS